MDDQIKDLISEKESNAPGLSKEPDYLAWYDKKVNNALAESMAHPEAAMPQEEVWKKFNLET